VIFNRIRERHGFPISDRYMAQPPVAPQPPRQLSLGGIRESR
jgi:hypothetical protein